MIYHTILNQVMRKINNKKRILPIKNKQYPFVEWENNKK
jgi:hypothetical protein